MPGTSPLTVVEDDAGALMVGVLGPLTVVHKPVPMAGLLPVKVIFPAAQSSWSGPAADGVGIGVTITCTRSSLGLHGPLVILHLKTYVPGINPLIVVDGEDGVTITGVLGPLTVVHVPFPIAGALPDIEVEEEQII